MDFDVAIIGAGPGGSTLARLLSESGLRIVLIDGQNSGFRKPCGGLLAPDAQRTLANFDLTLPKSVLVDPQIFSVKTIDLETGLVRYYPRHYLNMDRYAFDKWLLSLVPPSVELISGRFLHGEKTENGFLLRLSTEGGERTVSAGRIVGADGAGSAVRRSFFGSKVKSYVAIQQWFVSHGENPFYSCIFDPKTSESCSWSIHKDGFFIFGGCFAREGGRAAFEKQKKRLSEKFGFEFGEPVKTEACLALSPRHMRNFALAEGGVYLIGEAAGFISPSSFEGISGAILSARALACAITPGGSDGEIARRYKRETMSLRLKLRLKVIKRWFMYTPFVRKMIMLSGLQSIEPMLR